MKKKVTKIDLPFSLSNDKDVCLGIGSGMLDGRVPLSILNLVGKHRDTVYASIFLSSAEIDLLIFGLLDAKRQIPKNDK